jgi:DNA replication protein DnaC
MTDDNQDRYERKVDAATVKALIGEIDNLDPPMLGRSLEWWEQRDREVAEAKARSTADLEKQRITRRAVELQESGFPERFVSAALGQLDDTTAMKAVGTFVYLPNKLLVLSGGTGVGKTTAVTWVALMGQDPRPGFLRVNELERRGRYDKKLDEWLKEKTSLVIDDVGAEFLDGKGAFRSLMDEIVDAFYANRRMLAMTTNLRPKRDAADEQEQFLERYGERVWSRLYQSGLWVNCGNRDLRRRPA